jgi:hypothetical protein
LGRPTTKNEGFIGGISIKIEKEVTNHYIIKNNTSDLARSITWNGSKQSYFTGRMMMDRNLQNDYFRAFAYIRWMDDVIDIKYQTKDERIMFIKRQKKLIDDIYKDNPISELSPEEKILGILIGHDKKEGSYLKSFILNMFAIIEFDVYRNGRIITQHELKWYSKTYAKSMMGGLHYFIGNNNPYPYTEKHFHLFTGVHIAHLLRDMLEDINNGFINIPLEYLEINSINPEDFESSPFRAWVRSRVELGRRHFTEGKRYLNEVDVLRRKLVGYWYIIRFESILKAIERDNYILRPKYNEWRKPTTLFKFTLLSLSITFRHIINRVRLRNFQGHPIRANKQPRSLV